LHDRVIIIGGSHAAVAVADQLRRRNFAAPITILSDEDTLPYQKPPLSKAYMAGEMPLDRLLLRPADWYETQDIELKLGCRVTQVDRGSKTVAIHGGETVSYHHLVLATGARARTLPPAVGGALDGVHTVRTLGDAHALMSTMKAGQRLAVIGGGYIGLEAAAEAAKKGLNVTVVEAAPRILQRVACKETADAMRALHEAHGVSIRENCGLERILSDDGQSAKGVMVTDGTTLPADLVIVGIGIVANIALAEQSGLETDNAIVVDDGMRTNDPTIFACGDCTIFPYGGMPTRLESVQNAHDQAEIVAAQIVGENKRYAPVPWFWSDQYDMKLQIAGLNRGYDHVVRRRGNRDGAVSHFYFSGTRLLAADCLNDAKTYAITRRLLAAKINLEPEDVANPDYSLKSALL